jgi:hypothetical protein
MCSVSCRTFPKRKSSRQKSSTQRQKSSTAYILRVAYYFSLGDRRLFRFGGPLGGLGGLDFDHGDFDHGFFDHGFFDDSSKNLLFYHGGFFDHWSGGRSGGGRGEIDVGVGKKTTSVDHWKYK